MVKKQMFNPNNRRRSTTAVLGFLFAASVLLGGCEKPETALATWDGGALGAAEFDAYLLDKHSRALIIPETEAERLIFFTQEIEQYALKSIWITDAEGQALTDSPRFLADYRQRMRTAVVAHLVDQRNSPLETPDDVALGARFEEQKKTLASPEKRELFNLFIDARNHPDKQHSDLLRKLRHDKILDQYTFKQQAREHSDSETAQNGGLVGVVTREQLSEQLGELIFSLQPNQISEVLTNRTGSHLFMVGEVIPAIQPDFKRFRKSILDTMETERVAEALQSLVKDATNEIQVHKPSKEEFEKLLQEGSNQANICSLGDFSLSRRQFLVMFASHPRELAAQSTSSNATTDVAWEFLSDLIDKELVFQMARTQQPEVLAQFESHSRSDAVLAVSLEKRMTRWLEDNPQRVIDFFNKNQAKYLSPERILIGTLEIPQKSPVSSQIAHIRSLMATANGVKNLGMLAAALGLETVNPEWVNRQQLFQLRPGLANQVDRLSEGEVSDVFAGPESLVVVQLLRRTPPKLPNYDEAKKQVTADYRAAHLQQIYTQLLSDTLKENNVVIHEHSIAAFRAGSSIK